jgi:hypothetical protein
LIGAAFGVLLAPLPTASAGGPNEILQLVPDDAWCFVIVKSLNNIDEKATQLKELVGLPFEGPVSDMALSMLQLGDTIDKSSAVGAILLDFNKFGGQNASVILIPAKDPKALLEKLSAEEPTDGVYKCAIMGEPSFAAIKGNRVLLSPSEDCITKVLKTKKSAAEGFAEARMAALARSDLFVSVAVRSIWASYKEMVMGFVQMAAGASGADPKDIEKGFKIFEDLAALDLGFTLDKSGFSLAALATPHEGSDLQMMLADQKNTSDSILTLLPKERFLIAFGGLAAGAEQAAKMGNEHPISLILKMAHQGAELDQKALGVADAEFLKLQRSVRRYAASASMLTGGPDGMIGMALVAETPNSKEFLDGTRKLYKALCSISEDEDFDAIKKCIVHTPDAESIAGKKVDTIKIDFAGLHDEDKEDAKRIETVLGKDTTIRFGAMDDRHVVVSWGGGEKRYEAICAAAKSGDKLPADSGITEASGHLPSPRCGEFFIAVDTVLRFAKDTAKAIGEKDEIPVDVPMLNAPIAGAVCVQDKIARYDLMVPTKLIKAGSEAIAKYQATIVDRDFDEDADEDGEEATAKKPAGGAKAGSKAKKPAADEEEGDDDADAAPSPSPGRKGAKQQKPAEQQDDESDE